MVLNVSFQKVGFLCMSTLLAIILAPVMLYLLINAAVLLAMVCIAKFCFHDFFRKKYHHKSQHA